MNLSEIDRLAKMAKWTGCVKTQEFFSAIIPGNISREVVYSPQLKKEFNYLDGKYGYLPEDRQSKNFKYVYDLSKETITRRLRIFDFVKQKHFLVNEIDLQHNDNSKMLDNLLFIVENYSIVDVDIDSHAFILLYIDGKIYILDSYEDIRKPEIREFDVQEFRNYIISGSVVSYNRVFNTLVESSEGVIRLMSLVISFHEY